MKMLVLVMCTGIFDDTLEDAKESLTGLILSWAHP